MESMTQPVCYPKDKTQVSTAFEQMENETIVPFSSDYPHRIVDDSRWRVKHLPDDTREDTMSRNEFDAFKLLATVPRLEGQARVF